jgi:uncharacterized protein
VAIQFDLIQLGRQSRAEEHLDRTYEPGAFTGAGENAAEEGYAIVAPVHLVMDVRKQGDVFQATGTVTARLRLECGRCLEPFEIPVHAPFDLRYAPAPSAAAGDEREVGDDDLTTAFYRDHAIDLEELMREQFQLALPMKPLCSESCRGLCPTCGGNLNTNPCTCEPAWEDPRLAGLKSLLDRSSHD